MNNPEFAELIQQLKDSDGNVRRRASTALGKLGDAAAVPALEEALKDDYDAIRICAARALGEIGDASAIPALIESLSDQNYSVRHLSEQTLAKIGVPAVPALIEALSDDRTEVRGKATIALMDIGDATAVPALIEALRDEDSYVREWAARALGQIGDASAVPALVTILRDNTKAGNDRANAARALGAIGDPSAILALIEAIEVTFEVYKDVSVRASAAFSLVGLGNSDTLPRKTVACSRLTARERVEVLSALRRVRYKTEYVTVSYIFSNVRSLCQAILGEEDVEARKGAREVLNWLNGERDLLLASQRETATDMREYLRASRGAVSERQPETLLAPAEEPKQNNAPHTIAPTLWRRLFGRRKDASS